MNKFLRYSLSLVLAFVASVTFAGTTPYKVLTFPDEGTEGKDINGYDKTWKATIGEDVWTIVNFNTYQWKNWKYIKCGSKNFESVASITSPAIDQSISNIVLTIDNITKDKINSIKLQVATDADCKNVTEEIPAKIEDGDLIFKPTKSAANNYYKFVFDCQKGSRNGLIQISKIAYYKVGDAPEIVDITNTAETAYTIAKAKELIDAGKGLSENVYVKGTVSQASKSLNDTYGSLSYYISDDGKTENELQVYGGLSFKGEKFTSVDDIKVGDVVVVYGKLKKYNTTYELDKDNILISLNGKTTGITNITTDETAKNAPVFNLAGQKVTKAYKGVVIKNGKKMIQK
jgi:RPA family protein